MPLNLDSRSTMDLCIILGAIAGFILILALAWRISGIRSVRHNKKTGETVITEDSVRRK